LIIVRARVTAPERWRKACSSLPRWAGAGRRAHRRQELVLPPKTTLGQAYAFNLFLLKAVMNGRADQLIDLAKVNLWR
jgi:hypothetical protein